MQRSTRVAFQRFTMVSFNFFFSAYVKLRENTISSTRLFFEQIHLGFVIIYYNYFCYFLIFQLRFNPSKFLCVFASFCSLFCLPHRSVYYTILDKCSFGFSFMPICVEYRCYRLSLQKQKPTKIRKRRQSKREAEKKT